MQNKQKNQKKNKPCQKSRSTLNPIASNMELVSGLTA
jgi:hypothetical protein